MLSCLQLVEKGISPPDLRENNCPDQSDFQVPSSRTEALKISQLSPSSFSVSVRSCVFDCFPWTLWEAHPTMGKAQSIPVPAAVPHHQTLLQGIISNLQEKEYKINLPVSQSTMWAVSKSVLTNSSNHLFPHPPSFQHTPTQSESDVWYQNSQGKSLSKPPPSFRDKSSPQMNYPHPFASEHKVILKVFNQNSQILPFNIFFHIKSTPKPRVIG